MSEPSVSHADTPCACGPMAVGYCKPDCSRLGEPVSPADTIRHMMDGGDFCSYCARPIATEQDWTEFPEGGGLHLCWDGGDVGCTDDGAITLRRDDVAVLLAVGERDKADHEAAKRQFREEHECLLTENRKLQLQLSRLTPVSDPPSRERDKAEIALQTRRKNEWFDEAARRGARLTEVEAERERDGRQIARLTEALAEIKMLVDPDREPFDPDNRKQLLAMRDVASKAWVIAADVLAGEEDANG